MTETEWRAATDPMPLLDFLKAVLTDRRLRLFMAACCDCVLPLVDDPKCRHAIEVASRYADGEADLQELENASIPLVKPYGEQYSEQYTNEYHISQAVCRNPPNAVWMLTHVERLLSHQYSTERRVRRAKVGAVPTPQYTAFLRDIFNPFCPVALNPAWLTSTVTAIAAGVYDDRAFDRVPILADALQDAGCEDADLLDHLRGAGPHVRGCWALDLILWKS